MKIAFLIPSLANAGPNIFTRNLVEALAAYSTEFEVVIFYCRPAPGLTFPVEARALSSLGRLEAQTFDWFFSTMLRADLWLAFAARGIPRCRRVSIIHNMIDEDAAYLFASHPLKYHAVKLGWALALKRIGNLIVSSPYMAARYTKLLGPRVKQTVIPYGITDPRQRAESSPWRDSGPPRPEFVLVTCGNLIARKNFAAVIRALPHLPNTRFRVIGEGPERARLGALAKELGVEQRLEFLGFRHDLAEQLAQADCYVMPSYSEGYGLALLEAIGLGMPVVCSNLSIYDHLMPAAAIPRFDPDNTSEIVAAVNSILREPAAFAARTRQLYENSYRAKHMAEKFYDFMRPGKL